MTPRAYSSLLGVLLGFGCVFPLLVKRDKKEPADTAEALLQQAQAQMREAQAKNRARAVQTITQKNNLQALVDQTQKHLDQLVEKAESPAAFADEKMQRSLRAEQDKLQSSLAEMQAALASAIGAAEAVKTAMRREEELVRLKVTEALALGAAEKQARIEIALAKSRMALTTNRATDLFVQAREKIQQTKAQRDLVVQIARTVETLEATAEEAKTAGSEPLHQKLAASRDALRQSALNKSLWKD